MDRYENQNIVDPKNKSKIKKRKIMNVDTGQIYSSLRDAEVATSKNGKYNGNLCNMPKK